MLKKQKRNGLILISLFFTMFIPSALLGGNVEEVEKTINRNAIERNGAELLGTSSTTPHVPFILNGSDPNYESRISSVSSGGNGTETNPYIIENYNLTEALELSITVQGTIMNCNVSVGIINVSDHVRIQYCAFGNASIANYSGIIATDSGNLTISQCNVTDADGPAFGMIRCEDVMMEGNNLMEAGTANGGFSSVYLVECNKIALHSNVMGNSGAITLLDTNHSTLFDNEIHASSMNPSVLGYSVFINGSFIDLVDNDIILSGFVYVVSRPNGNKNITITDNFMLGTQAVHPSTALWGAVTIDGIAGSLDEINIANNTIQDTNGDGIQISAGSKGITQLIIDENDILFNQGKGIDVDGTVGSVSPIIEDNSIRKNLLDGIHLWSVGGAIVIHNYIAEHHNPPFIPPMNPFGGLPSVGIMLVDCPMGGNQILANTIHDNDYGVVLYDWSLPNIDHQIQDNIITYNYYYGMMILDLIAINNPASPALWGQSIGNLITGNDFHQNNLGNPSAGIVPETYRNASQIFEEDTIALSGLGVNSWTANWYNDESVNMGFGVSQYWFDFDFNFANPPNPSGGVAPAGLEPIGPLGPPSQNTAPVVTPLNGTGISVYNGTDSVLRWTLSDSNLNGMFNGMHAWAKWNGTDSDFSFITDEETYLEIPLGELDAGTYNFTCLFNDTMDFLTTSTLDITILSNPAPKVISVNGSYISFDEWDLGSKGRIDFTFTDASDNIDTAIMNFNLTASNLVWHNESEGYAYLYPANQLTAGNYSCSVWVNDTAGLFDEASINIEVFPNHAPNITTPNASSHVWHEWNQTANRTFEFRVIDEDENLNNLWINMNISGYWTVSYNDKEGNITVFVDDDLLSGKYEIFVFSNDTLGATDQETITIIVVGNNDPEVTATKSVVNMQEGDQGVKLKWQTSDPDGNYLSHVILMNGKEVASSGEWNGGNITLLLDSLSLASGEYEFLLICTDSLGRTDQDSITVIVEPIEEPSLWERFWMMITTIIGAILTFLGLGIRRMKKNEREKCPCDGQPDCWCNL